MYYFPFIISCFIFLSSCSFDSGSENEKSEDIPLNILSQNSSNQLSKSYDSLQSKIKNTNQKVLGDFIIAGKIKGASGLILQLQLPTPNGISVLHQTTIDSLGNFRLTGGLTFPIYMYNLQLAANSDLTITLPLELSDSIHLNTSLSTFAQKPNISGVQWSKQANEIIAKNYMFKKRFHEISNDKNRSEDQKEQPLFYLNDNIDKNNIKSIKKNKKSSYNLILLSSLFPSRSLEEYDKSNLPLLKDVISQLLQKFPDSKLITSFAKQVINFEYAYQEFDLINSGKITAPDFVAINPDGNEIKLSDLKGKVVLLDFWASWCLPCRKENPNVVKMYHKFKSKGFEIFSFSLDEDKQKWLKAIQEDKLEWKFHGTDFKGWAGPMKDIYKFEGIPFTVLINKDGKIIAKNLRGKTLENKLNEIFK